MLHEHWKGFISAFPNIIYLLSSSIWPLWWPAVQAQEEEPQLAEARPVPRPPQAPQSPEPPFPRRQGRAGPHPQIPELLREGSQEGHPGHLRTLLQQDLEGRRLVRPPVLRPGLQHAGEWHSAGAARRGSSSLLAFAVKMWRDIWCARDVVLIHSTWMNISTLIHIA